MGHARIHIFTHTPSTLMLPHESQSTMTICPPTIHDPATPGHQWMVSLPALRPSRAGSKSTAHWPLRASFQVSLNPVQRAGRLCLRPSATPLLRTEEGAQQLACLFLLRVGFHHPAFSSNPSSPSNRVCAQASWAITTSRPRHHSPVPEVGPSFDHYWSKRHVTERT